MGRVRWVRRLNREIIDNFLLRTGCYPQYTSEILQPYTRNAQMHSTLLDSTPKDKENLAINGFVCASPWVKGYLLSKVES
jgi:hypothetical protein